MRVEIWQLFTVKVWELALADALMVGSTVVTLPFHKLLRDASWLSWNNGGILIQSIFQTLWFAFWVM